MKNQLKILLIIFILYIVGFNIKSVYEKNKYEKRVKEHLWSYVTNFLPELKIKDPQIMINKYPSYYSPIGEMIFSYDYSELRLTQYQGGDHYFKVKGDSFDLEEFRTLINEKENNEKCKKILINYMKNDLLDYSIEKDSIAFSHGVFSNGSGVKVYTTTGIIDVFKDDDFFSKEWKVVYIDVDNKNNEIVSVEVKDRKGINSTIEKIYIKENFSKIHQYPMKFYNTN